jgi:acyl-ACP thioesterase
MEALVPMPERGRTFAARRRMRLADLDSRGRFRLDAAARFLQDIAIDDVQETGWGTPEHLWFLRRIRVEVLEPFLEDRCGRAREVVQRAGRAGRRATVVADG